MEIIFIKNVKGQGNVGDIKNVKDGYGAFLIKNNSAILKTKENLVKLTAKEHFLCHRLLCEIYPDSNKLKHALFLMAIGKQKKIMKYYISGKVYERLKTEYSNFLRGRLQSDETKTKKSMKMKEVWGNKTSEDIDLRTKKMIQTRTQNKSFNHTEETKKKISDSLLGRKMPWRSKIIQQFTLEGELVREWESIASIKKDPSYGFVGGCIRGVQKTAYGYIWEIKK
jgi:hypothetical protein